MSTKARRHNNESPWARPEPGAARPRFSRDRIAEVAIEIAEKEGVEALSMRRLAQALGSGTMTLYYYLHSKRELLALVEDRIIAEIPVPDGELAANWRDALAQLARRAKDAWMRRSWAVMSVRTPYIGPNAMRYFEQTLAALADTPLTSQQKLESLALIDNYVLSFVMRESAAQRAGDDWIDQVTTFMSGELTTGKYPHIRQLLGGGAVDRLIRQLSEASAEERFERGLSLILDGVAGQLKLAKAPATQRAPRRPVKGNKRVR